MDVSGDGPERRGQLDLVNPILPVHSEKLEVVRRLRNGVEGVAPAAYDGGGEARLALQALRRGGGVVARH